MSAPAPALARPEFPSSVSAPVPGLQLEIAHVLFVDIVGYTRLLTNEQHEAQEKLNRVVRNTDAFRSADAQNKLICLPTGDGMALVFATTPDAPVCCALQIDKALRGHSGLRLRMGVHSGPVTGLTDVNQRANVAGSGINIAQRVMDCGDAGHILLSKRVAGDLAQYGHWQPLLHLLGRCEVKHGEKISLVSLHGDGVGNPEKPSCLKLDSAEIGKASQLRPGAKWARFLLFGLLLSGGIYYFWPAPVREMNSSVLTPRHAPPKSIAVLPFENLNSSQETAFFTDGVQDEILSNLAKVADLKVISRTSVLAYKTPRARNLREIGQQLGVANILEGSVQRSGNRVRINAQLIDARTDAHLWAQSYDRELADVFAIQSEIARAIADQLQAHISPSESSALAQPPTTDVVAEKLFVQARAIASAGSNPDGKQSLLQAVALLDEAITRDPHFLRAYGLLVTLHLDLYWQGFDHTSARRELAHATVERAAQFAPDSGEVHLARANYAYQGFRDYDTARAQLEIAQKLMPNSGGVFIFLASVARRQGRWADALEYFQRGLELDPLNYRFVVETGYTFQAMRQFGKAQQMFERALRLQPHDAYARVQLAQIAFDEMGDTAPLHAELARVLEGNPQAATEVANALFECALAQHDAAGATRAVQAIRPEGLRDPVNNSLWTRDWFVGLAAHTFGDHEAGERAFTAARVIEQRNVQEQPEYAPAWGRLGLLDAALGHKDDAIREGQRACELLPVAKDAWDGTAQMLNLAKIYAWVGERQLSLAQLESLARMPGGLTYGDLKMNPEWNALRAEARFTRLLDALAPRNLKG